MFKKTCNNAKNKGNMLKINNFSFNLTDFDVMSDLCNVCAASGLI